MKKIKKKGIDKPFYISSRSGNKPDYNSFYSGTLVADPITMKSLQK